MAKNQLHSFKYGPFTVRKTIEDAGADDFDTSKPLSLEDITTQFLETDLAYQNAKNMFYPSNGKKGKQKRTVSAWRIMLWETYFKKSLEEMSLSDKKNVFKENGEFQTAVFDDAVTHISHLVGRSEKTVKDWLNEKIKQPADWDDIWKLGAEYPPHMDVYTAKSTEGFGLAKRILNSVKKGVMVPSGKGDYTGYASPKKMEDDPVYAVIHEIIANVLMQIPRKKRKTVDNQCQKHKKSFSSRKGDKLKYTLIQDVVENYIVADCLFVDLISEWYQTFIRKDNKNNMQFRYVTVVDYAIYNTIFTPILVTEDKQSHEQVVLRDKALWLQKLKEYDRKYIDKITTTFRDHLFNGTLDDFFEVEPGSTYNFARLLQQLRQAVPRSYHKWHHITYELAKINQQKSSQVIEINKLGKKTLVDERKQIEKYLSIVYSCYLDKVRFMLDQHMALACANTILSVAVAEDYLPYIAKFREQSEQKGVRYFNFFAAEKRLNDLGLGPFVPFLGPENFIAYNRVETLPGNYIKVVRLNMPEDKKPKKSLGRQWVEP